MWNALVLGCDVGANVLVEELEDERDTVGKHQVLTHVLKLQTRESLNVVIIYLIPVNTVTRKQHALSCLIPHS